MTCAFRSRRRKVLDSLRDRNAGRPGDEPRTADLDPLHQRGLSPSLACVCNEACKPRSGLPRCTHASGGTSRAAGAVADVIAERIAKRPLIPVSRKACVGGAGSFVGERDVGPARSSLPPRQDTRVRSSRTA